MKYLYKKEIDYIIAHDIVISDILQRIKDNTELLLKYQEGKVPLTYNAIHYMVEIGNSRVKDFDSISLKQKENRTSKK